MLSSKSEESSAGGSKSGQAKISRRGSIVNQTQRTGMKAAMLNISMRAPKPKSLPSYLVKVLLSLVQARLEAQVSPKRLSAHTVNWSIIVIVKVTIELFIDKYRKDVRRTTQKISLNSRGSPWRILCNLPFNRSNRILTMDDLPSLGCHHAIVFVFCPLDLELEN